MTQKELLYVEDAVEHEKSIIKICSDLLTKLDDNSLISFIEEQIDSHDNMKNELMSLLKEKANG